jgi:AcrR family transcriptional regulator
MDHKYGLADGSSSVQMSQRTKKESQMTDPRVTKTRAALAEAVLALASEKPFADVTITEIAARAGVGYASFFRHFKDKDALLTEVADQMVTDLLAIIMPALIEEDTLATSIAICRYVDEHRLLTRALLAGGAESRVRDHIVGRSIETAQLRVPAQPSGIPYELIVTHSVSATLGLLGWWLEHGASITPEAMGEVVDRLVMSPVRIIERMPDNQ